MCCSKANGHWPFHLITWTSYCSWLISAGQLSFCWSLMCVNFPWCLSARLQIVKAGRWASTAALQSVHCHINDLLTCHDFSDFLSERTWIWMHLKKACLQDVGGFRASVALVADIISQVRWQRRALWWTSVFFCSHSDCVAEGMRCAYREHRYWVTFVAVCLPRVLKGIFFVLYFRRHNQNTSRKHGYKRNKDNSHCDKLLSFFYPINVNWQLDQTKKNTAQPRRGSNLGLPIAGRTL